VVRGLPSRGSLRQKCRRRKHGPIPRPNDPLGIRGAAIDSRMINSGRKLLECRVYSNFIALVDAKKRRGPPLYLPNAVTDGISLSF
jgi:hypothetical protein